ncbi:MAG: 5'-nucleotidase C-terminal domain-containing protein [Coprobacillus sp.]|nr:5'-nucleotidase C-terminal domain-containing protein [Coprobacillus sp.]
MKKKILSFSLMLVLTLGACDNTTNDKDSFYLTGFGSYMSGLNYSIEGGVPFSKDNDSYVIKDIALQIGDVFTITNGTKSIAVTNYDENSSALKGNNIYIDENGEADVLKTGNYTVSFIKDKKDYIASIELGIDTKENIETKPEGEITLDIFANGDQHGVLEETQYNNKTLPSMPEYVSFIKDEISECEGETLLISNGDLWQGTYESNFNYGALLNDIITETGYSSFTLGNHEFDWGQDVIKENMSNTSVPYLGANIVYRDTGELVNYVQPYTIVEKGGLKIGIIGTIGRSQLTSITSTMVKDIEFLSEENVIKEYSDILRSIYKCDIVISSMHTGTSNARSTMRNLGNISAVSGEKYVDAVFTAHDHANASGVSGNTPYVNSGENNQNLSHIQLIYNNGEVTCSVHENLSTEDVYLEYEEDIETRELIDSYCDEEVKSKGDQVAGTIDSNFSETREVPNMMAEAMYEYVIDMGYDIDLAIVNDGRANLYEGEVTYSNLLDAIPFFNKTVIMEVAGLEMSIVARSNYYYSSDSSLDVNRTYTDTYLVATYDYIAYHQSTSRAYDNFSYSLENYRVIDELDKYPCDILYDYMTSINGTIKAEDYNTANFTFLN